MKKRETKGLDTLAPNPNNPRVITEWKKQALRKSLEKFGDLSGIVFNIRTSQLVGGHQRIEAFLDKDSKGDYKGKVVVEERLPKPDSCGTVAWGYVEIDGARHSYREVDWDAKTDAMANIAANQHGGEFEWQGVSEILKSLGEFDPELTGFPDHELENLLKADWQPPEVEPMPDTGGKIDQVYLTQAARKAVDEWKVKSGQSDDAAAIETACMKACET